MLRLLTEWGRRRAALAIGALLLLGVRGQLLQAQSPDWAAVDAALGRPGAAQEGGVRRWAMPRSDLRVTAAGITLRPAFALGAWLAMVPHEDGVMAMGDLVLLEDELNPVLSALQAGGVEQTAIHHHVMRESPRVLYMHIHGHGDPVAIARTVAAALARTGTPGVAGVAAAAAPSVELDTTAISAALGRQGRANGGVWQVGVPRAETLRDAGVVLPAAMGVGTVINFQPTGGGRAAITGDFVMVAEEVNRVMRALRGANIEVTSLHNHLLQDDPRLFFVHFWAHDDAVVLARGLRHALDETNSVQPTR